MAQHEETQDFLDQLFSGESRAVRADFLTAAKAFRPKIRQLARIASLEHGLMDEADMVEDSPELAMRWEPLRQKYKVTAKFLDRTLDDLRAVADALRVLDEEAEIRKEPAKAAGYTIKLKR